MTNYECENRISDDEIISSLEVIATTRNCSECKIRNCNWGDCNCSKITANAALDIINRQKTEIERLNNNISAMAVTLRNSAKATRNEAIKEFAERLKKRQVRICDCFEGVSIIDIDKLAKETEG